MERGDIKVEEPLLAIKDFNISTDEGLVRSKRHPVQTAQFFLQRASECLLRLHAEKLCSGSIDKLDLALDLGHDYTLLQRAKNSLQKAVLTRPPDKIVLDFLRLNPPDALDQFIDE